MFLPILLMRPTSSNTKELISIGNTVYGTCCNAAPVTDYFHCFHPPRRQIAEHWTVAVTVTPLIFWTGCVTLMLISKVAFFLRLRWKLRHHGRVFGKFGGYGRPWFGVWEIYGRGHSFGGHRGHNGNGSPQTSTWGRFFSLFAPCRSTFVHVSAFIP